MGEQARTLLVNKLSSRYAEDGNEDLVDFIHAEVSKLMNGNSKISSTKLQALERKIERGVKGIRRESDLKKATEPTAKAIVLNKEKPSKKAYRKFEEAPPFPLNNYLVFSEATNYEYEQEQRNKAKNRRAKQLQVKLELDRQLEEKQLAGGEEKACEEQYAAQVKQNFEEWKESERDRRREVLRKNMETKALQDEQLAAIEARRTRIKKLKAKEEGEMIRQAQTAIAQEAQRQRNIVEEQRQYMFKVQAENEKQKILQAKERLRRQEEDKKLQDEYAANLDEQERLRTATFAKMKEKSSNNQKMYMLATEDKLRFDEEVERKALEYQAAKIAQDNHKEDLAIARKEQAKRDMTSRLAQQIADKRAAELELKRSNDIYSTQYKQDAVLAIEAEKEAAKRRRERAIANREELKKQIESKRMQSCDTDTSHMTEQEKRINLPTLLTFSKDSGMVEAIGNRLARVTIAEEMKAAKRMGKGRRKDDDYIY